MNQNNESILQKKAILVYFSAPSYTGIKKDKRGRKAIAEKFGSDETASRAQKETLPLEKIKKIMSIPANFRNQSLYKLAIPYRVKGEYLLPVVSYDKLMDAERMAKSEWEPLVDDLVDNEYENLIEESKKRLNGLFDISDYLTKAQLKKRFSWKIVFSPVPSSGHLIADITNELTAELTADMDNMENIAIQNGMKNVWHRVFDAVSALSKKMKETRKDKNDNDVSPIFRDSIIENIKDLVELLPSLNITDDPALEQARKDLENDLIGIDPDQLRENETDRKDLAKKADKILDNIGNLF